MLGIKLFQQATEKRYIHINVTENWLWSTRVTPAPSIDTLIINLNLKLVWQLSLLRLVTSDPIVKSELLNECVSSIFQTDNNIIIAPGPKQLPILSIDPVFTIAKVKTLMRKLNPKSAGGSNGIPPIFLKTVNTHCLHR